MVDRLDVAMTPAEAPLFPGAAFIAIDALRATTTIATLFARGLRRLRVVSDLEAGRAARSEAGVLLFGEEGGLRPEGFDHGNSPSEAASVNVEGREAVLVTSNGTKAVCAVAALGTTLAGALVNITAATQFANSEAHVVLVCAGNAGARKFSLEDFAVAAAFVQEFLDASPGATLGDGALLARTTPNPAELISISQHAGVTRGLGFAADIQVASTRDAAPSLPVVVDHGDGWAVLEDARLR